MYVWSGVPSGPAKVGRKKWPTRPNQRSNAAASISVDHCVGSHATSANDERPPGWVRDHEPRRRRPIARWNHVIM